MHLELEGMLVAAVNGLRRAVDRRGYDRPASVLAATGGYRDDADPLRRFVDDCVIVTDRHDDTIARSSLYARYSEWCEQNGHRQLGATRFRGRLVALDPRIDIARKSSGIRLVGGVQPERSWS
jgi:phage/plasmid-associated DNA primase